MVDYFVSERESHEAGLHALPTEQADEFRTIDPLDLGTRLDAFLAMEAGASDACPLAGAFPVVALVHTETWRKSVLAEYLASHGYVVVSVPVLGSHESQLDVSMSGIETQSRDTELLLGIARRMHNADPSRIAIVGTSFGALSALRVAMLDPSIDALVSLDGGIGSTPNVEGFGFELGAYHDVTRFRTPTLHVYGTTVPGTDLEYLRRLHYSTRLLAGRDDLDHAGFGGDAILRSRAGQKDERVAAYVCVAASVKSFLDERLRDRKSDPDCREAPFASVEKIAAAPPPPSVDDLVQLALRDGGRPLQELVDEQRRSATPPIPEERFVTSASRLLRENRLEAADAVTAAQLRVYELSMRANYQRAVVASRLGRNAEAFAHYTRAIELSCEDTRLAPALRLRLVARARAALVELQGEP